MNHKGGYMNHRELYPYMKSIIDQDTCAVVICNLHHEIIYMNPTAIKAYEKWGGKKLLGQSLLNCHNAQSKEAIYQVVAWFAADESHNIIHTFHNPKQNKDGYMVALRDNGKLIGYYEKHEFRNPETRKPYQALMEGHEEIVENLNTDVPANYKEPEHSATEKEEVEPQTRKSLFDKEERIENLKKEIAYKNDKLVKSGIFNFKKVQDLGKELEILQSELAELMSEENNE